MASLQLRLDCAGVSLQRLSLLDRITVLFNSSKYSLAISPNYEEKTSSVAPVDSKPAAAQISLLPTRPLWLTLISL